MPIAMVRMLHVSPLKVLKRIVLGKLLMMLMMVLWFEDCLSLIGCMGTRVCHFDPCPCRREVKMDFCRAPEPQDGRCGFGAVFSAGLRGRSRCRGAASLFVSSLELRNSQIGCCYKTAFGSPSACLGHGRAAKVRLKLQQLYLAFSAWDLVSCMLVCCLGSYVIFDSDCYIAQHPELTNLPLYAINPNPDVLLIARVRPLNL